METEADWSDRVRSLYNRKWSKVSLVWPNGAKSGSGWEIIVVTSQSHRKRKS